MVSWRNSAEKQTWDAFRIKLYQNRETDGWE